MTPTTQCPRCKGAGIIAQHPLEILRRRAGKSQADVAAYLKIGQSPYSKFEAHGRIPWRHLEPLEKLYGVTRGQLRGQDPLPGEKPARPHRLPPAGAVAKSKAHRAKVAAAQKAKAKGRRP